MYVLYVQMMHPRPEQQKIQIRHFHNKLGHCACVSVVSNSPRVDTIIRTGSPEELAQVLANTLPEDLTGALALFNVTHQKFIHIQSPTADWLRGDDGYCIVPEE